jgi:hypothetical protein
MSAPVPRVFTGPGSNTFLGKFAGTSTPIGHALANKRVFNPKPDGNCLLAVFAWFLVLLGVYEPSKLPTAEEMRRLVHTMTHVSRPDLFVGLGALSNVGGREYLGFGEVAALALVLNVNVWVYDVHSVANSAPVCLADYFMATETSQVSRELLGHLWNLNRSKPPMMLIYDAHACHFGGAYPGMHPLCLFGCLFARAAHSNPECNLSHY